MWSSQGVKGYSCLATDIHWRSEAVELAARLRPGDAVMLRLRPWLDAASRYERINRTELTDDVLQLAEPCWGKLMPAGH